MRKHLGQNLFIAMFLQGFNSLGLNELYCISWQSVNKSLGNFILFFFFSSVTLSQQRWQEGLVSKNAMSFIERQPEKGTFACW